MEIKTEVIKYTCPMFHYFYDETAQMCKEYAITYSKFESFLNLLDNCDISTITPEMIVSGKYNPTQKYTMLTFDDGHKSNIKAAEILNKHNKNGVFYFVMEFRNNSEYMNESEIAYIHSLGHTIGIHGKYHNMWCNKNESVLISELEETKLWLEKIIDEPIITCSAPLGGINNREFDIIEKNFMDIVFIRCSMPGINIIGKRRILSAGIRSTTSIMDFKKIVEGDSLYYVKLKIIKIVKNLLRPLYNCIINRNIE